MVFVIIPIKHIDGIKNVFNVANDKNSFTVKMATDSVILEGFPYSAFKN